MLRRRALPMTTLALAVLTIVACNSGDNSVTATVSATVAPTVSATVAPTAAPTATPALAAPSPALTAEARAAAAAATNALASWFGLPVDLLSVETVLRTEWSDGCLEFGRPGQPCDARVVPGYHLTISLLGEARYEVRSNLDATQLVWATQWIVEGTFAGVDGDLLSIEGDFPDALAEQLQQFVVLPGSDLSAVASLRYGDPVLVAGDGRPSSDVPLVIWIDRDPARERPAADDPNRVAAAALWAFRTLVAADGRNVISVETRAWPDTCLGVPHPGVVCTRVAVPGYAVRIGRMQGPTYELRTDREGSRFVWAGERTVDAVVREVTVATSIRVETASGELIWARVVDPSTLGVTIEELRVGDRVRIALAPHPEGNGEAIVILERALP